MRFLTTKLLAGCLAVLGCCLVASPAQAAFTVYGFTPVTNENAANVATGTAQLTVTVSDVIGNPNQVDFTFYNSGPNASSITDVYFDDGSLLGIAQIFQSFGVAYSQGATPGDLPGGNVIDFNTSVGFSADSDPPAEPNGVNPSEWVTIRFDLKSGQTYADTISAINLGLANPGVDVTGGLRIGIHVQGFAPEGSESFVNGPANPVPAPPALVLALVGLAGFGGVGLRRRLKNTAAVA